MTLTEASFIHRPTWSSTPWASNSSRTSSRNIVTIFSSLSEQIQRMEQIIHCSIRIGLDASADPSRIGAGDHARQLLAVPDQQAKFIRGREPFSMLQERWDDATIKGISWHQLHLPPQGRDVQTHPASSR